MIVSSRGLVFANAAMRFDDRFVLAGMRRGRDENLPVGNGKLQFCELCLHRPEALAHRVSDCRSHGRPANRVRKSVRHRAPIGARHMSNLPRIALAVRRTERQPLKDCSGHAAVDEH